MRIVGIDERIHFPTADDSGEVGARADQTVPLGVIDKRRNQLRRLKEAFRSLERITLNSRVLIIEGISGSGKDMLQEYFKKKLNNRIVYDYSEGEVLHSWKQLQIEGIAELRLKLMKLFVNYVRDTVNRDEEAFFLLNRFHLSTYASTIVQQPKLEKEYDEIIDVLRTLPVHVFVLQLDENEIEKRSMHPERSSAWQKFQQQIVENHTFRERLEEQQKLILEAAKRQQIPYSVIKLTYQLELGDAPARIDQTQSGARINTTDAKISRRRRLLPPTLKAH